MMNSRVALAFIALIFSFTAVAQEAAVRKNDGTVAKYKLLPVQFDPSHAQVVDARPEIAVRDLPAEYQIPKAKLPIVKDQGQRGTCVSFATIGLMETYLINQNARNRDILLSEQCLVGLRNWEADDDSYTGDDKPIGYRPDPDGDYLDLAAKTVTYFGVPRAEKYQSLNIDCRYKSSGQSKATPPELYNTLFTSKSTLAYGKDHAFEIDKAPTLEKIKALIAQNIPVEIATLVYLSHFSTSKWDYNPMQDKSSTLAGGHAIILTGYRGKWFTFKNSWGSWGGAGFGHISERLLKHSWKYDPEYDIAISYHD